MDISEILRKVDHTVLGQASTWEDIKSLCDDGIKYGTASVCIPASFVKQASDFNIATGRVVVTLDELTTLVALFEFYIADVLHVGDGYRLGIGEKNVLRLCVVLALEIGRSVFKAYFILLVVYA